MAARIPVGTNHADLAQRVFGNDVIAETILSFTTDDPINNLGLRLVSNAFNKEVLRMVREEYRVIHIRKPREFDENSAKFKMNKKTLLVSNFLRYLNFLKVTANVTVEKVKIERMWPIRNPEFIIIIHRFLFAILINGNKQLNSLVGIREICQLGCKDCEQAISSCREYGPMQLAVLNESRGSFGTMIVDDFLINKIAFLSAMSTTRVRTDKTSCLSLMKRIVSTRFRCDQLVIQITADPVYHHYHESFVNGYTTYRRVPQPLPREVIDTMIELWQVKRLKFVFIDRYDYRVATNAQEWTSHGYFTEMRFDRSNEHIVNDNLMKKMTEVEVVGRQEVVQPMGELRNERDESYLHLMSVVRKAFPTNFRFLQLYFRPYTVRFVLQSALKGLPVKQKCSTITIQLFPQHSFVPKVRQEELFSGMMSNGDVIINLKRWRLLDPTPIFCRRIEGVSLDGVAFQMKDYSGNRIDLEIYKKSPWR